MFKKQIGKFFCIVFCSFVLFFLFWFISFKLGFNTLSIQSEDTVPALFLPMVIVKEHTMYLDSFADMMIQRYPHPDDTNHQKGLTPFYLRKVSTHYLSAFPVISPILVIPVYFLYLVLGLPVSWDGLTFLSHVCGSLIISFSGGFLFLLLKKHFSLSDKLSIVLTSVYLFGSINFALVSQALWQHGTLELFTILSLYFLFDLILHPSVFGGILTGFFLGLCVFSRPTSLIIVFFMMCLFFFTLVKTPERLFKGFFLMAVGFSLVLIFFLWYNRTFYLSLKNQGYADQIFSNWLGKFPQSFAGVWVSPSKGILIYSPVFIFSFLGLYIGLKNSSEDSLEKLRYFFFFLIIYIHTLVISFWKHWYGGWSFGYRMSSDVIPFFVLLMVPFIRSPVFSRFKKLFFVLLIFSMVVEIYGIFTFDGVWHASYDLGYSDNSWLWSIKDSEFIFNVRRILVKIGFLNKACPKCLSGL